MYPSFVIVHYAGRVCTGFTTFNKLRLLFSLLLLFNFIHSPCSQGYMYLGFYLTWRVWCYRNGNTVPSEGRVQPRPQAPLLLRRHRMQGILDRNTVQTSCDTTQAIQLCSFPSLSCLLSVNCSLNCSLRRPIKHCLLLFAHFLGKIQCNKLPSKESRHSVHRHHTCTSI